jgi:hypothetical protein
MVPDSNKVVLTLSPANNLDSLLLTQPLPQNKRQARQLHKVPHRLWIEKGGMGFADTLHCWCAATLSLDYAKEGVGLLDSMEAMADAVQAFGRTHATCEPRSPRSPMDSEQESGGIE